MGSSRRDDVVEVGTALAVLSRVNLLEESRALAVDIGGSLAKLLYLQPDGSPRLLIDRMGGAPSRGLSVRVPPLRGTLHFFAFETRCVGQLVAFIREHWAALRPDRAVRATGGGAYKYAELFSRALGVRLARLDEMACVVAGLNFMLASVESEAYVLRAPATGRAPASMEGAREFAPRCDDPFPYLLVNIGSGVSVLKVTGHAAFERVSGSALGGGTFWGLARLLLNCSTFDDVLALTHAGADNTHVDMLVADIYGGAYAAKGLGADVIAASFGKVTMRGDGRPRAWARLVRALRGSAALWLAFALALPVVGRALAACGVRHPDAGVIANNALGGAFRPCDVALALLRMVSYNIGQIAYLNARVHGMDRIYFGGNFIRDNPHTIADISFAVDFWSGGKTQALFLRHDGYLGAIGAFLGGSSEERSVDAASAQAQPAAPAKHDHPAQPRRRKAAGTGRSSDPPPRANGRAHEGRANGEAEPSAGVDAAPATPVKGGPDVAPATLGEEGADAAPATPVKGSADVAPVTPVKGGADAAPATPGKEDGGTPGKAADTPGGSAKRKRGKRAKKKKAGEDAAGDGDAAAVAAAAGAGDGAGPGPGPGPGDAAGVVFYDDVYHESYRAAAEGEWQTVHRRRRTPGTSQSESEET